MHFNPNLNHKIKDLQMDVECGSVGRVQEALAMGVEPRPLSDAPLLHVAATQGHSVMLRTLAPYVDLESVDKSGSTALMVATKEGHLHAMDTLRTLGARMDHTDREGRGLCHYAVWSGNVAALDVVLAGAVLNARDINGHTALDEAISYGAQTIAVRLAKAGITLDVSDSHFESCPPLGRAARVGLDLIVGALLDRTDVDVDATDKQGMTAFLLAAQEGYEACARLLLDAGANPHHVNAYGLTADELAQTNNHEQLATWLRRARLAQLAQADKPVAARARM